MAKAQPDGYTLLFAFTGHVLNPSLIPGMPFDTVRDFAPIVLLATNESLLAVHPSLPVKSVPELIALAKKIRASTRWARCRAARSIWAASCSS